MTLADLTENIMAGIWKVGENFIRRTVKTVVTSIQHLKPILIVFDPTIFGEQEVHIIAVDTVNFITEEFRLNPSTKWFDYKSNSSGLKYQFAMAIRRVSCLHLAAFILLNNSTTC